MSWAVFIPFSTVPREINQIEIKITLKFETCHETPTAAAAATDTPADVHPHHSLSPESAGN